MRYSATLLASLPTFAHGFGSTPPGNDPVCIKDTPRPTHQGNHVAGSGLVHGRGDGRAWGDASPQIVTPAPPVACTTSDGRAGERFFVYSVDFSILYNFAETPLPHNVTHGLVGKTWEGLQLSITQDRWIDR